MEQMIDFGSRVGRIGVVGVGVAVLLLLKPVLLVLFGACGDFV
jgi:hypothetical protein